MPSGAKRLNTDGVLLMSACAKFRYVRCQVAVAGVALLFGGLALPAGAEDSTLKQDAKQAGHAVGSAVHEVGHGAKKVGKEIGHGAKEAGKAIGSAAREGGKEFHRAIKGDE
jgi:hypothetical protein